MLKHVLSATILNSYRYIYYKKYLFTTVIQSSDEIKKHSTRLLSRCQVILWTCFPAVMLCWLAQLIRCLQYRVGLRAIYTDV